MLQLSVTDDSGAVTQHIAAEFPLLIGRSPHAHLRLAAPGVWEEHASLRLVEEKGQRVGIEARGDSLLLVNGESVRSKALSPGDEITIGAARVVVSLAPAQQTRLQIHELAVWALLLVVMAAEALAVHFAR